MLSLVAEFFLSEIFQNQAKLISLPCTSGTSKYIECF